MAAAPTTWMAPSADGRLEVFVVGFAGSGGPVVWHLYQIAPAGGWSQWVSHGSPGVPDPGRAFSQIITAPSADGRLELFTQFGDGGLWHIWQTARNNGWTPTWVSHGFPAGTFGASGFALGRMADGRLDLFAVAETSTSSTAVYHITQTAPSNGWSGWIPLGGPPGVQLYSTGVGASSDGRLEVFATSNDALWHIWQKPGGGWSEWTSHSTPAGVGLNTTPPVLAPNSQGRLELFVVGDDHQLWHLWQTAPSGGWSGWTAHGAPPNTDLNYNKPALAAGVDGRLELFICGADRQLWHIWQTTPGGGWSPWTSHGRPPQVDPTAPAGVWETPALALNSERRLELLVVGTDGALWHIWQTAPGQGWSDWLSHGSPTGVDIAAV